MRINSIYKVFSIILVISIVAINIYSFIGDNVLNKSIFLFEKRNKVIDELNIYKLFNAQKNITYISLHKKYLILDQEFDANRIFLEKWNAVWRLGFPIQAEFSNYDNIAYKNKLDKNRATNKKDSIDLIEERALNESRNIYFRNRLSAYFILELLNSYLLPMLYGSLGAIFMIMRSISRSREKEFYMEYSVTIILGAIAGMGLGVLLDKSSLSFYPFILAFLAGYNIELLFKFLDNKIHSIMYLMSISTSPKNIATPTDHKDNKNK